ncbi:MAG: AAA family ATPase [Caldilineaceae bacterium]
MNTDDNKHGPIFIITGTPGAGKTTISTALMQRFAFGLHIPCDDLREWVVAGNAPPVPIWTDETERQFHLSRRVSVDMATRYASAGFAVAIDDVIFEAAYAEQFAPHLVGFAVVKVLLAPSREVALSRNLTRTNKDFDTALLNDTTRQLHGELLAANRPEEGWQVIDSSGQNVAETVEVIFRLQN